MKTLVTLLFILGFSACTTKAQLQIEDAFPALTFARPVDLQHPNDGTNRLFVLEQAGVIRVFENLPSVAAASTFLDIRSRVNSSGNEEGLLGLAFHPDFKNNGVFFVNYTANPPRRTIISRFKVSATNPNVADATSEEEVLMFSQPYSNHNGGQIQFGPDRYLYISTGDGGSGGDPQGNGQNRKTLLGKILRIDVDHSEGGKPYAIPPDNPYANNAEGFAPEIYAYGLRNPWRFSFDPVTGWLWTGDVGQNRLEEIDIVERGGNYGWNIMEGTLCYNPPSGCDTTGLILPLWEYGRSLGISVTGGFVYRGRNVPEIVGEYVYADFGSGRIWGLNYDGSAPAANRLLVASGLSISSFGVDAENELYICTFSNGGKIYRFKPTITDLRGEDIRPDRPSLGAIRPHPLREGMRDVVISFSLPKPSQISVTLLDFLGRSHGIITSGMFEAGSNEVRLILPRLSPGTYLLQLATERGSSRSTFILAP